MYDYDDTEDKREDIPRGPAAPSCYGCAYMVASPMLDCIHPNSVRVMWDPIRNRSYRIPSIMICREQHGLCQFYKPSPERSAEYTMMKEIEEEEKSKAFPLEEDVGDIINKLNKQGTLDKFMDKLNRAYLDYLTQDEEEEEEE